MNAIYRLLVRFRVTLLFIVLEIIALLCIVNSSYYQHAIVINYIRLGKEILDEKINSWRYYFSLEEINEQLAQENNELQNRLGYYNRQDSLKQTILFDTLGCPVYSYIPAVVANNSVNNLHNYITLNIGADHGIVPDMGVVVYNGLIGTVVHVSEHYSLVKSLLSVNWRVSAKVKRSGAFGPLYWNGINYRELIMADIPQHIPVAVGDTIVSSGYSAFFPPDIPVGIVKAIETKRGNFYEITVTLFADFKQLRYVNAVKHLYQDELKELASFNYE
ncbi:MAG: rod shape-determining protein MreC [Prevotellaceae bacterium]|jgi:rod shape-determining protein MreC|nr:rod shape-determining protein MreC [Prevotellaceae bacterium]